MSHYQELAECLELSLKNRAIMESPQYYELLKKKLFNTIKVHNPRTILKLGVGSGELLRELAEEFKGIIVVVEPSLKVIEAVQAEFSTNPNVRLVNGYFHKLPIDYFKIDMVIAVDVLHLFDTGRVMDEIKRSLDFDGILFFAGQVLNNDDIEGVLDDFVRLYAVLHNDYYLENDFYTFLRLKDFTLVKNDLQKFTSSLVPKIEYWRQLKDDVASDEEIAAFYEAYKEDLEKYYQMKDDYSYEELYLFGTFRKNRPEIEE